MTKQFNNIFTVAIALLFSSLFFSCEEPITIDTGDLAERVVIEGLITNEQNHYIKLTRTRSFYGSGPADQIQNAIVSVKDDLGNTFQFAHNPDNDPTKIGFYYPVVSFQGQIGATYSLDIEVDGDRYNASEKMLPVTSIDSLVVTVDEDEKNDPEEEGSFYEILFYAQEPQDRKDQYLFKFYKNGEILKDEETDIYVTDDILLGEAIDDVETAGFYRLGEVAGVEMYSLTQEAFIFYSDMVNLLNSDGGMFSPPPANPRTNLSNNALGYFQVSAVSRKTIVVTEPGD